MPLLGKLGLIELAFGLSALSCNIYCPVMEVLAFIAGIGLGAFPVTLFVWI